MEPQLPSPEMKPEQAKPVAQTPEYSPFNQPNQAESTSVAQPEQLKSVETKEKLTGAGAGDNAPAASTTALPQVTLPVVTTDTDDDGAAASSTISPVAAADDDVIEKEWVSKAKKVVAETKGDPYLQEHEVSKLQADYLQKRYGKQVKMPEDT